MYLDPTAPLPTKDKRTHSLARLIAASCAAFAAGFLATVLVFVVLGLLPNDTSRALTTGSSALLFTGVVLFVFFGSAIAVGVTVLDGGQPRFTPALPPVARDRVGVGDESVAPTSPDVIALARAKTVPSKNPWLTFGVTFVLFAIWIGSDSTLVAGSALLATLLIHEAGHWAAMRVLGYEDTRIFFVPFLGAATAGRKIGAPGWQECAVLLMGPAPGLLLAVALSALVPPMQLTHSAGADLWLRTTVPVLVVVNLLNLLPVAGLDGGRLCMRLLFSRRPRLEVVADGAMSLGLALLGVKLSMWFLCAIGVFSALTIRRRYRIACAARRLRDRGVGAPGELAGAPDDYLADLLRGVRETFRHAPMTPSAEASWVQNLHERLEARPMGTGSTLSFLALYFVVALVGLVGLLFIRSTTWTAALKESDRTTNGLIVAHYPPDFVGVKNGNTLGIARDAEGVRREVVSWLAVPGDVGGLAAWARRVESENAKLREARHETWATAARVDGPCFRDYPGLLVTATETKEKGTWSVRSCFFVTARGGYLFETRVPPSQEAADLPLLQKILDATEIK